MSYEKGLRDLGGGSWAYLQPDGSWGWSNAGLITDGDASLLVDTLFDNRLTGEMLATMRASIPSAASIGTVVNTHANGDHCWGNGLLEGAEIIASRKGAAEMEEFTPETMAKLTKVARLALRLGPVARGLGKALGVVGADTLSAVIAAAPYLVDIFGDFDFEGVTLLPPTKTFDDTLTVNVGAKRVELIEVGPAHTKGDLLVHVPDDGVVYAGDILFIGGHPIVWEGPISNWIAACKRMESMTLEAIVPGHGPITDRAGVARLREYLEFIEREARARYDAGMSALDAAWDIAFTEFEGWGDAERIVINVDTLYREFSGGPPRKSPVPCFAQMARYVREHA